MNNHITYIGARYVPLFAGEWEKSKEYEALSVVSFNGDTYTSTQAVPANTDLTNIKYWLRSGIFNAQLENLRNLVNTFDARITAAEQGGGAQVIENTKAIAANRLLIDGNASEISKNAQAIKNNEADIILANASISKNAGDIVKANASISKNATDIISANASISNINKKFPLTSNDISNGSITAGKLNTTAIKSILDGFTIRYFDNQVPSADNADMIVPSGITVAGFYIVELEILIIFRFSVNVGIASGNNDAPIVFLPSYVPNVKTKYFGSNASFVKWTYENDFVSWSGLTLCPGERLGLAPNSALQSSQGGDALGTSIFYMRPFSVGSPAASTTYDDLKKANGLL